MSDQSLGLGWWQAADGKWYPPESHPSRSQTSPPTVETVEAAVAAPNPGERKTGWFRGWKRWATIGLGAVIVIGVLIALLSDNDDDPGSANVSVDEDDDAITAERDENEQEADIDDSDQVEGEGEGSENEEAAPSTTSPTPEPAQPDGGTRDNPWAYDKSTAVTFETFGDADGSVWNVTIGAPQDITQAVLSENQFNDPPAEGVVFVGFSVEMVLIEAGKEPLSPGFNFSWEILGGSTAAVYDTATLSEGLGCGVTPDDFDVFSEVFVGGTLTGTVCIPIPTEDLTDPKTQVALNFSGADRVIFGEDGLEGAAAEPPASDDTTATGSGAGDRQAPYAYDKSTAVTFETFGDADGSVWNVTIGAPQDITQAVLSENQFNDPPAEGVVFVGFSVEMVLIEAGKEPLSPGFNFSWEILGGSTAAVYDTATLSEGLGCGVTPDDFDVFSEVFVGGTLTGTVCIPIPTEDLTDPKTQVALNFSDGNRAVFGQ